MCTINAMNSVVRGKSWFILSYVSSSPLDLIKENRTGNEHKKICACPNITQQEIAEIVAHTCTYIQNAIAELQDRFSQVLALVSHLALTVCTNKPVDRQKAQIGNLIYNMRCFMTNETKLNNANKY